MNYFPLDKPLYSQTRTEPTDASLIPAPVVVKCAYPPCEITFAMHDKSRRRYHGKECAQKHQRDKELERGRVRRATQHKEINPLLSGDEHGNRLTYPDCNSWVAAWNAERQPKIAVDDTCARYAPGGMV